MEVDLEPGNCTLWGRPCLQADLEDYALNPWLQAEQPPGGSLAWWAEGAGLPVLGLLGAGAHLLLLSVLARRAAWPADWPLALLSLSCLLLLAALLLDRPAALLLTRPLLPVPALPGLLAARRGLDTLVTLLFIIFVGDRHLRQLEAASYSWWRPAVFCLAVAVLSGLPALWELRVDRVPGELVAGFTAGGNFTQGVEVLRRTELWHNPVYKNMVRHLLPLLTSQVATVWLLPIILLHSRAVGQVLARQRKRVGAGRGPDRLLPALCLLFILLSLPGLADILIQVLLLPPPPALAAGRSLSLALLLLLLPLLTLGLDPALRLRLTPCTGPRAPPRRHQWFGNIPLGNIPLGNIPLPTEDLWRTEDL